MLFFPFFNILYAADTQPIFDPSKVVFKPFDSVTKTPEQISWEVKAYVCNLYLSLTTQLQEIKKLRQRANFTGRSKEEKLVTKEDRKILKRERLAIVKKSVER